MLSGEKDDSNATSESKQRSSSESTTAQSGPKKVAPPPGFKDTAIVKDSSTEVKPTGPSLHGDMEPPPGFKGEAPQASKGSKRRAEELEEAQAKKLKGIYECHSLVLMLACCCVQ